MGSSLLSLSKAAQPIRFTQFNEHGTHKYSKRELFMLLWRGLFSHDGRGVFTT